MRVNAGAAPATVSRCGRSSMPLCALAHGKAGGPAQAMSLRIPTSPETGLPRNAASAQAFGPMTHRGRRCPAGCRLRWGLRPNVFSALLAIQPPCGDARHRGETLDAPRPGARRRSNLRSSLCALAAAPSLAAQRCSPGALTLDPLVVTAARSPQPLVELVADVTVIGPDEIARAGAQSLAELLQRQPGVRDRHERRPARPAAFSCAAPTATRRWC